MLLAKVLLRCMAGAALTAALGPALIVMIVASVVLGGAGLPVPLLGIGFWESQTFRIAILVSWALLFLPAAKATIGAPGTRYLLQFSQSPALRVCLSVLILATMTAPLAGLLWVGGGLAASATAVTWILAVQITLAGPVYPWLQRGVQLATLMGLFALLYSDSHPLLIFLPLLPVGLGIAGSIRRSDCGSRRSFRRVLIGGAFVSLVGTHLSRLWRRERALVARIAISFAFGVALMRTGWAANYDQGLEESLRISLAIQTPGLAAIAIMMALAGRSSLRELGWLLASLHISPKRAMATSWAASVGTCSLIALGIAAASLSHVDGSDALLVVGAFLVHGLALSCAAQWLSFGPLSGNGIDNSRPAVLMVGLAIVLCIAVGVGGHKVLLVEGLILPLAWVFGQKKGELYA